MVFTLVMPAYAYTENTSVLPKSNNAATYIDQLSGDVVKLEAVSSSSNTVATNATTAGAFKTQVSKNGQFEKTITVDFDNDKLIYTYADGTVQVHTLSDVVKITKTNNDVVETEHVEFADANIQDPNVSPNAIVVPPH